MIKGWIAWVVVTLYVIYSFSLNTAASVFSPAIETSLHTTSFEAAMAVAMFVVGFALMQIPAGYLLDRYRAKTVVSTGIFILAAGNLLTSYSTTLVLFSIANLIQGIGASFAFIAAGVLVSQWFKPKYFPIMFGLTQSLAFIFSGVLHYVFVMALQTSSWNSLYLDLSYFGFVMFVLSLLFVSNPVMQQAQEKKSLLQSLKIVCSNPQLWLCTIAGATSFGVMLSYASFWYMKVQIYHSVDEMDAMIISGAIFLGVGVGSPLLGVISNFLKSRKMVLHISLSLGVMFLLAGIYLPRFDTHSLLLINTVSFMIGLTLSAPILFFTIINETFSAEVKGIALSVLNASIFLFNSIMLFMPYSLTTSKVFFTSLWLLPATIMIAILLLFFIKETYPGKSSV